MEKNVVRGILLWILLRDEAFLNYFFPGRRATLNNQHQQKFLRPMAGLNQGTLPPATHPGGGVAAVPTSRPPSNKHPSGRTLLQECHSLLWGFDFWFTNHQVISGWLLITIWQFRLFSILFNFSLFTIFLATFYYSPPFKVFLWPKMHKWLKNGWYTQISWNVPNLTSESTVHPPPLQFHLARILIIRLMGCCFLRCLVICPNTSKWCSRTFKSNGGCQNKGNFFCFGTKCVFFAWFLSPLAWDIFCYHFRFVSVPAFLLAIGGCKGWVPPLFKTLFTSDTPWSKIALRLPPCAEFICCPCLIQP